METGAAPRQAGIRGAMTEANAASSGPSQRRSVTGGITDRMSASRPASEGGAVRPGRASAWAASAARQVSDPPTKPRTRSCRFQARNTGEGASFCPKPASGSSDGTAAGARLLGVAVGDHLQRPERERVEAGQRDRARLQALQLVLGELSQVGQRKAQRVDACGAAVPE